MNIFKHRCRKLSRKLLQNPPIYFPAPPPGLGAGIHGSILSSSGFFSASSSASAWVLKTIAIRKTKELIPLFNASEECFNNATWSQTFIVSHYSNYCKQPTLWLNNICLEVLTVGYAWKCFAPFLGRCKLLINSDVIWAEIQTHNIGFILKNLLDETIFMSLI